MHVDCSQRFVQQKSWPRTLLSFAKSACRVVEVVRAAHTRRVIPYFKVEGHTDRPGVRDLGTGTH